jgi:glucan phosphoethanolaminetransferase (alkaline phosphatase superfamily)
MTEKIILYTIIGIAVSTALAFLSKATGTSIATDESGLYNLRMNKFYGMMGLVGLVFGLLFLIFLPLTAEQIDKGILTGIVLMLLIFWGTGIPCFMYYRNHKVSFDNNSIKTTNVYGKVKEIQWSDISDIRFNAFSGLLVLKTNNETIKVHQHLVGLLKFIEHIENKTKWTRKELKVPIGK